MARERDDERDATRAANDRPLGTTIDQAGDGEPDDSSRAVEISPEEERRIAEALLRNKGGQDSRSD